MAASLFHASEESLLSLVKECQFIEDYLASDDFTRRVLGRKLDESKRMLKKSILNENWMNLIKKARNSTSCNFIVNIASDQSWLSLWDLMLNHGCEGTVSIQALLRIATWQYRHVLYVKNQQMKCFSTS